MMSDFEYDCWQRKRIAQQAKYRKCGSKSKKCSMSTDHMTQKQWKERNGKVVTVNLNQPITWDDFKALTASMQEEYLKHMMENFCRHVRSATTYDSSAYPNEQAEYQVPSWSLYEYSAKGCVG